MIPRVVGPNRRRWKRILARQLICGALFLAGLWTVPSWWWGRTAGAWYDGDETEQGKLSRGVAAWLEAPLDGGRFRTGDPTFDGEWFFGTYMMAAMGFGQTALEHPAWRARHGALMDRCIDRLLSPEVRRFDRESWGADAIESLDGDGGHAAYLGYLNLALSLRRLLDPGNKHAALNDRITAALVRRIGKSPTMLLSTYPRETYPVDNCAVIGSIGLYDRAAGADHAALIRRWSGRCRERYVDLGTGLLYQAVDARDGTPADKPRGSGTAFGLYFLSFADPALSRDLYAATKRELATTLLGFGAVREYPAGCVGLGDIDSGPIVLGCGLSTTGFSIAGARIHGDRPYFRRLVATVCCFGAPLEKGDRLHFVTGGPLGDAILFAMLTAQPGAARP
ncbi:MAG: hypothetical protein AAB215_04195 [Planctomycetota bacterium]